MVLRLTLEAFLESLTSSPFTYRTPAFSMHGFACASASVPRPQSTEGAGASLLCHSIGLKTSAGISTCCPSATLLSLTLGPDLPRADEPSPGNLGLSTDRILTCLFVTYTGILTSNRSTCPPDHASPLLERSPTTHGISINPQIRCDA